MFSSSKCTLFHNSNVFGSCTIHVLYTVCAKIKKKFRRQKVKVDVWTDQMKGTFSSFILRPFSWLTYIWNQRLTNMKHAPWQNSSFLDASLDWS